MNKKVLGIVGIIVGLIGFIYAGIIMGVIAMIIGAVAWEEDTGKVGFWIGAFDFVAVILLLLISA